MSIGFFDFYNRLYHKIRKGARKKANDKTWPFIRSEIIEALQQIPENALWDTLIGENAITQLRLEFSKVKSYRNDVMHAHSMNTASFSAALKLIKEINEQLDVEIGKIIAAKEIDAMTTVDNSFNTTLGNAIKNMKAIKLDPAPTEILRKLKEIWGETKNGQNEI